MMQPGRASPLATTLTVAAMALSSFLPADARAAGDDAVEKIVLVRHGEKPANGLGQLNCKGLNRALALPPVIANAFGRPSAIFAPDPSEQKEDDGVSYDYVRPLATIEPTAIFFGLPVNASFGLSNTDGLQAAIEKPRYRNAVVLVAWEYRRIETIARALLSAHGGDPVVVPKWRQDDLTAFMSSRSPGPETPQKRPLPMNQGLDGQPEACPH